MEKGRTLYISDLDGTLLNSDRELSDYTRNTLNSLIADGLHFSAATARTAASAVKILSGLDINVPVILMNGALIYDIRSERYIKIEALPSRTAARVTETLVKYGATGFMYAVNDDIPVTFYESLERKMMKDFYDERVSRYYKSFERLESLKDGISGNQIIYFTLMDEYEPLKRMLACFKKLEGLESVLYRDVYSENGWFLELHSSNASKYNAVRYLREYCGFDRITGFGDNLNDVPLFKACDECYAVSNAVSELREIATGIIGKNTEDGVVRFLYERIKEKPWRDTAYAE
jgi:Cof subfamily protein (haloacid dehalogenase superfamily)